MQLEVRHKTLPRRKPRTNVIGPVALDDWYYMRMLRESVKHAKEVNPIKFKQLIDIHSRSYKEELHKVVNNI